MLYITIGTLLGTFLAIYATYEYFKNDESFLDDLITSPSDLLMLSIFCLIIGIIWPITILLLIIFFTGRMLGLHAKERNSKD